MTKEEIEQYIDLDNKIKNRIVQISHALKDVKGNSISKFIQGFSDDWNLETYDKKDFFKNSRQDKELHLGLDCYNVDGRWGCHFNKSLLMMTDEQVNEIVDYGRKVKKEEIRQQKAAKKAREAQMKKETEEKEYEQYLKLKKKFEKE